MKKKSGWYFAGVLALAMVARASVIVYNANLVNTPALAYSTTYPVNLQANGIGSLSAQAVYSSATILNATFTDGSSASGSLTVLDFTKLSAARASNNITVASTSNLTGAAIVIPGYVFINGIDWATGATPAATALSIKNALATVPYLSVSQSGSVVYATAPAGAVYNTYGMTSSNGNIVVASALFTGGQDNAIIRINGTPFQQGLGWTAATSNNATASSLASAINALSPSNSIIKATPSGAGVNLISLFTGAAVNYPLQTSTPSGLSVSGANMTGGTTAGLALGSSLFTATNGAGLTTALPVLYTGSPAVGGLSSGSTYYAVPVSGNSFMLAKYSTSAVAGNTDLVVVTSTSTQASADTYTLAPLGISGTPSFKWQASNDGTNWSDLAVSSVTISSYSGQPFNTIWAFGYIGTQLLRLNVVAPTTGGLALKVTLIGTN